MSFEGKVVAITGAASGMGLATAKILADRGARLSLADVQEEALTACSNALQAAGKTCMTTVINVASSAAVDAWIAATVKEYGRLDYAVNCAGIGSGASKPIVNTTDEDWAAVQDVNLKGVFYCLRAQLRAMKPTGGAIVSIASTAGLQGFPTQASYCASKHGVIGLTKTAAKEAGPGVRVNCVCPGVIDTPLVSSATAKTKAILDGAAKSTPARRAGSADEVAKLMVWLVSDEASFVTGAAYVVDGGMLA